MKLKELNLISFGKFKNCIFELDGGLNVLYGENESGKTTIHNFVEGMFYGFQKANRTKKTHYEEWKKYTPWLGGKYAGIMTLEKEEKIYRIERDFKKDRVKVYDNLTGKDITDDIDTGEKVKIHLPGLYFFDFNCLVYRNTISIRQLENRVDDSLSKEVKDKLINITTTLDDEISVKDAVDELDSQLSNIGSERAYKQPYAMAQKRLNRLKKSREEALNKKKEYDSLYEEFAKIKDTIESERSEIKELEDLLNRANMIKMKEIYEEALRIKSSIDDVDKRITDLKPYSNISEDDYYYSLKIQGELRVLKGEIDNIVGNINTNNHKLKGLGLRSKKEDDGNIVDIYDDYSKYIELEEEKKDLLMKSQENRIDILNSEHNQIKERNSRAKIQTGIFLAITIISLGLIYINGLFSIGAVLGGILAIYSIISNKTVKEQVQSIEEQIKELRLNEEERKQRIDYVEGYQKSIFEKYRLTSKTEFLRLYEDTRFEQANRNEILKQIDGINLEINNLKLKLNEKVSAKNEMEISLRNLFDRNGVEGLEQFKESLDKKLNYENLKREKESKKELFKRVIGDNTIEELEQKIINIEDETISRDIDDIAEELKLKQESYAQLNSQYSRIEANLDTLNNYVKELLDIEEEINRIELDIEFMDKKKEAINRAKEVILKISEDIHNQFAPTINKDVSQLINRITNGKYTNVRIDENLGVTVENPQSKEIVSLDNLSGGTIDQMHFALRFSIINSIKEENLPLILDDCFIQYDDGRLKNMLKYLDKIANNTQILLFTCQNREIELLNSLNLKYNLIELS